MALMDEIVEAGLRLASAVNAKDAAAAAACATSDAALLPPGEPPCEGPVAIEAWWQDGVDRGLSSLVFAPLEVSGHDDEATEVGRMSTNIGVGKYMALWKRTAEGWRLHRAVFNFDA